MVTDLIDGSRLMVLAATVVEFVFLFLFFFVLDCDLLRTIFSICVHKKMCIDLRYSCDLFYPRSGTHVQTSVNLLDTSTVTRISPSDWATQCNQTWFLFLSLKMDYCLLLLCLDFL